MKFIFLSFLLIPSLCISQSDYIGFIKNKVTNEPIPFATVGLMRENRGTNADEKGAFQIKIFSHGVDTLLISSVGYDFVKMATNNLPTNATYYLEPRTISLNEVIVSNKFGHHQSLNDFTTCGMTAYSTEGYITQIAQLLTSEISDALLSEVSVCREGGNARFRFRIYDVDPVTGGPSSDLADTIIEVTTNDRHVHINVEKYRIHIPAQRFFVAIEWLRIPMNEIEVTRRLFGRTEKDIMYIPFVTMRKKKNNPSEIWIQDYTGKWKKKFPEDRMLISAEIKY